MNVILALLTVFAAHASLWHPIVNDDEGLEITRIREEVISQDYSNCEIVSPPGVSLQQINDPTKNLTITYPGYGDGFKGYKIAEKALAENTKLLSLTTSFAEESTFVFLTKVDGRLTKVQSAHCRFSKCVTELTCNVKN